MNTPLHILFVEDSPDDVQMLLLQLEQEGLEVEYRRVGTEQAYTAALDSTPHLILSDFTLPQFNGLRALRILKQRGLDIPFILVSGTVGEDIAVDAIKQGADDYIMKDRPARLGSAIQHALEQKRLREEKIRADEVLRESEERFRAMAEQIPPIVYTAERNQHIGVTYISPRIESLGFTQEEWVANPELWLKQIHPDDQARVLDEIKKIERNGEPFKSEYRLRSRDGIARWFLDEVMDILDSDGNILFRQGFMLDITERKQSEETLYRQNRYLELLNDMTHSILAEQDFDAMMNTLVKNITALLDADDCYITHWDPLKKQAFPVAATAVLERPYKEYDFPTDKKNLTTSALEAETIIVAEDAQNSPHTSPDIVTQFHVKSAISIPLIFGKHKLGAAIIAFNEPHHFTPEEIERAEHAGDQIALALWNARQESRIQQRLRESGALSDIGRALSETERVGTEKVLQLIVDSARELIPEAEQSVIHLLDKEKQSLLSQAVSGFSGDEKEAAPVRMRLGAGVAGQVIHEGITINVGDIETDSRFLRPDSTAAFRSLLVAPVQSGGQQIGTISVQSSKPNAFSDGDAELIKSFGVQAAIAIENTHLFEATQNSLKEVNALYQISRGLVSSLDATQLIKDSVDLLQTIFGYYSVRIYLINDESGDLIMSHASGVNAEQLISEGLHLSAGEGIIGHVAETKSPFVTNNAEELVFFRWHPLSPDTQSEMAVPILIDEQVVGILDIHHTQPNQLTENDLQLMVVVADQLSVALQKANLYASLQTSLNQEQEMRSQLIQSERLALVGRLLASVSHELNNPLQAIQNALFLLKNETQLSTQASQDLDIILAEAERMAALIERLRSTYRPMRFKDFQSVQLNDLIEDVHALIVTHARHKEIAFEFYPEPHLPAISGLPDQIRQVVLNLFINAIEVMEPGGRLTVHTRCLLQQNEVLLSVKDTGPGIDGEILPKIFDPFITDKHTGTGLGLTITHDIIQQHHGRIEARNDPEGGAVFNVWLPIEDREGME